MADQKLTALNELGTPALDDIAYVVHDPSGTPDNYKLSLTRFLGLGGIVPSGRLTLTSGNPVTSADVTAAGTLYYTPYASNCVRLYDGTRWRLYSFTERSLSLSVTSGKNYDVFLYDNSGTLTLELSAAWTNDTTRADALTTQDGIYVKSGATTRLWLGTIRASGANTTEDSAVKRFVWNYYRKELRPLIRLVVASHTYTTASWRPFNNSASASQVELVVGAICSVVGGYRGNMQGSGTPGMAWAMNSTSAPTGRKGEQFNNIADVSSSDIFDCVLGYNYWVPLEYGSTGTTFERASSTLQVLG